MSRISVEGEKFWVHEICRIWTSDQTNSSNFRNQSCVLCGVNSAPPERSSLGKDESMQRTSKKIFSSRCVVKCAAPGCHISVHPMCALASSLTSSINEASHEMSESIMDNIQKSKKNDVQLCSQYTLTFSSTRGLTNSLERDPGARCTASLPIIFCGIHNPAREQSFHGLYPGGKVIDKEQTLKLPSY